MACKSLLEEFKEKAYKKHNNKYSYDKSEYINRHSKILITCFDHGDFWQKGASHLEGRGCPKCGLVKITLASFIERANKIHNNKYDYSKTIYHGSEKKLIIVCPEHGEFEQEAGSHLRGYGCKKCSSFLRSLNKEDFKKKANEKHDFKYNYDKVVYINSSSKIVITCLKHGDFSQDAGAHLRGQGCPKCAKEQLSKKFSHNTEIFISKGNEIHNYKYDYSQVNYVNSNTKIKIICPIHGEFLQSPNRHLNFKDGCPQCGGSFPLNNQSFIERANQIHNFVFNYSKVNYKNSHTKIIIICPKHGEFEQKPYCHLQGDGCVKCSYQVSKPEIAWLDFLKIPNEYRQKVLFINNKRYNLDAFDPNTNTIYEFYGDYWHGNPNVFSQNKIHPKIKISFGDLYEKVLLREKKLKDAGYDIISIWESDWNKLNKGINE